MHLALAPSADAAAVTARIGLAVPRAVGGAVVRNRVRRRLRALCAERLAAWPASSRLVIRAMPGSASASYAALAADLDRAYTAALARASGIGSPTGSRR